MLGFAPQAPLGKQHRDSLEVLKSPIGLSRRTLQLRCAKPGQELVEVIVSAHANLRLAFSFRFEPKRQASASFDARCILRR